MKNLLHHITQQVKNPGQVSRGEVVFLACLVTTALALRIGYHYEMRGDPIVENLQLDEQFHDRWAQAIAKGDAVGEGVFFRAPLYPYLIGITYWIFGIVPDAIRILQHLLGAVLVGLVYFLTRYLFGRTAALVASLLAVFYSVLIYFEGRLLFDSSLTFLITLWLVLVVLLAGKPEWPRYALFGLLFGLICTMRPPFLALALPLLGYLVWTYLKGKPQILCCSLSLAIAFLLPIAVVTARNVMVGGDFVLVASQGGINFYIGNNPQADGMSSWIPEAGEVWGENRQVEYLVEQALGRRPLPSEVSAFWYARGLEFLRDKPGAFTSLLLKKLYLFWSHIEIANNLSYYWFERASNILKVSPVGFWLVGPLGFAGAIAAWKKKPARLLVLFVTLYWLVTALFFISDRFRLPVIPVLCVLAGYAIHDLLASTASRTWKSVGRSILLIATGILLVNTNFTHLEPDVSYGDDGIRGQTALHSGDLAKAAQLFERAASMDPDNSTISINLGTALWGLGKTQDAVRAFRGALQANPFAASINLAHLYFNMQEMDSALLYGERALEARPYAPGGYIIAAKVMLVKGNTNAAEGLLRAGLAACTDNFVYGEYLLAGLYLQSMNALAADSLYRRVLLTIQKPRQPDYSLGSEKEQYGEDLPTLYAKTLHGMGRVFAMRGLLDSSEVYLRSAAHALPMKGDVWADWGVCLLRMNRLEEADTVMNRAVRLSPASPAVWFNYATVLARKGEHERARQALVRALALKPDLEEARKLMNALKRPTR
jgi:tetratricopeptide (TPR) repeat protein